MQYVIYGAGAIGGTIGARLSLAGCDVTLIARGGHGQRIASHGLSFRAPGEDHLLRIPVVAHPADVQINPAAGELAVLLCMKSQHTAQALQDLLA